MRCLLLFCLAAMAQACFAQYVDEVYPKNLWVASDTFYLREVMNVDRRNFIKFREFNRELMRLRAEHAGLKVVELYPYILEWCRKQIQ